MPKLPNVTNEDIKAALDKASDLLMELDELAGRIEKGYVDSLDKPLDAARVFNSLVRAAADLTAAVMTKSYLDEHARELEAMLRARQEKQAASG